MNKENAHEYLPLVQALLDATPHAYGSTKKLAELLVKERAEFVAELTKARDMANALARAVKRVADICEEKMKGVMP